MGDNLDVKDEQRTEDTDMDQKEMKQETEDNVETIRAEDIEIEDTEAENTETSAEAEGTDEEEKKEQSEKRSLFGKKKDKKDKKDIQIEELTDRLKRQMAEFDNFRKRTDKEKSSMYEIGAREVLEKILPIVDNFERGLEGVSEEEKNTPFVEGMGMVYKQLLTTLEDIGVKPIEAVGKEFDLNLHNAVMHVEQEEAGENEVIEEFQKGYTYKDSVIRHSMVKVAN